MIHAGAEFFAVAPSTILYLDLVTILRGGAIQILVWVFSSHLASRTLDHTSGQSHPNLSPHFLPTIV